MNPVSPNFSPKSVFSPACTDTLWSTTQLEMVWTQKILLDANYITSICDWGCGLTSEALISWWITIWKKDFILSQIISIPWGWNSFFLPTKPFFNPQNRSTLGQGLRSRSMQHLNHHKNMEIWIRGPHRSYLFELPTLGAHKSQGVVLVDISNHRGHPVPILSENGEPSHHGRYSQRGIHIQATEIVINC